MFSYLRLVVRVTWTTLFVCLSVSAAEPITASKLDQPKLEIAPFARAIVATDGPIVRLRPDDTQFPLLRGANQVRLHGLPIDEARSISLDLHRIEVFSPSARIVRGTANGDEPLPVPEVTLFGGRVAGRPDSSAYLSVSSDHRQGWIMLGRESFILSDGPHGKKGDLVIYSPSRLTEQAIRIRPFSCDSERLQLPDRVLPGVAEVAGTLPRGPSAPSACRRADLAIETDFEYTNDLFGGDLGASAAYTASLIGAVSEIFKRDFNTELRIVYLRLWDTNETPWDQGNTLDQLFQFQDFWNAEMTHVTRNAVHFLSGRPLGGGVAYLPGLCYPGYDYGLSANLGGAFPYPLEHNHWQNWDPFVVAHEIGHKFNAPHTHNMTPPVDCCGGWAGDAHPSCGGTQDCSAVPDGTIMSYCHTCAGGMLNIRLEMHTRTVQERILPLLTNPWFCDLVLPCDPVGDCNGDGVLDLADVECFVDVTLGNNPYNGPMQRSDMLNDGTVNGLDAQPFVDALTGP